MKIKYFLFTDSEVFQYRIEATSWRQAITQARDIFQIKGRLVISYRVTVADKVTRDYHLTNSAYAFTLTGIVE